MRAIDMGAFAVNDSTNRAIFPAVFSRERASDQLLRRIRQQSCVACKMCTIQTSRRPPIARQTQISKTAPMNPAIR